MRNFVYGLLMASGVMLCIDGVAESGLGRAGYGLLAAVAFRTAKEYYS